MTYAADVDSWYPIALLLAAILVIALLQLCKQRARSRIVERGLFYEVRSLRTQAAAVAAEIARRHASGENFDSGFFAMWRLSEPLIYPGSASALSVLKGGALDRVGYFHAQLADARSRLAEARTSGAFEPSLYRILSCLVRPCNEVKPWLDARGHADDPMSWELADLTHANALLSQLEASTSEPVVLAYNWADTAQHQTESQASGP